MVKCRNVDNVFALKLNFHSVAVFFKAEISTPTSANAPLDYQNESRCDLDRSQGIPLLFFFH